MAALAPLLFCSHSTCFPRRPRRLLWLLPCLTPRPTASQSALEHPWSTQVPHLAHPWSPACGGMAAHQYPVESSSSTDRFSVFSSNIWCSVFPSKSSLQGVKLTIVVIILQLPYPENNNRIVNGKKKTMQKIYWMATGFTKNAVRHSFYYYRKQEENPYWRFLKHQ